jgi:hypothetical protein
LGDRTGRSFTHEFSYFGRGQPFSLSLGGGGFNAITGLAFRPPATPYCPISRTGRR